MAAPDDVLQEIALLTDCFELDKVQAYAQALSADDEAESPDADLLAALPRLEALLVERRDAATGHVLAIQQATASLRVAIAEHRDQQQALAAAETSDARRRERLESNAEADQRLLAALEGVEPLSDSDLFLEVDLVHASVDAALIDGEHPADVLSEATAGLGEDLPLLRNVVLTLRDLMAAAGIEPAGEVPTLTA
jgi:hypothetical protein